LDSIAGDLAIRIIPKFVSKQRVTCFAGPTMEATTILTRGVLDHADERVDHLGVFVLRQSWCLVVRRPQQAHSAAGSFDSQPVPGVTMTSTARRFADGVRFFCQHVLDRRVLHLKLAHAGEVRHRRAGVLALPRLVGRRADAVLAAHLHHRHAGLAFSQDRHDLALAELALPHRPRSFVRPHSPDSLVYCEGKITTAAEPVLP
jgi:hypothetical protein